MTTETNANRLKAIKRFHVFAMGEEWDKTILPDDITWLIEQAERVQQLEQQNAELIRATKKAYNNIGALPKVSVKAYLLHTFERFWDPELVAKLKDGEQT